MTQTERLLRYILGMQGMLYLATNLWGLIGTHSFILQTNPLADIFETRRFAALGFVISIFFLAGVWRKDLLKPAAFLGLGSSLAVLLVELFHLPSLGWSLLWIDLLAQAGLAGCFITMFFFRRDDVQEPSPAPAAEPEKAPEPTPAPEPISAPGSFVVEGLPVTESTSNEPQTPIETE